MDDDFVKEQYQRWVYPYPIQDLSSDDCQDYLDPSWLKNHVAYWPDRTDWAKSTILVAGCGTNQAAAVAYHNRASRVVGIDVSSSSLAHENVLKEKHGLDNLELRELPLEDAPKLGTRFDLIICGGVLHHLRSPEMGLHALRECLDINGSLGLMVYGKYRRTGVYMFQELFRLMNLKRSAEDLEVVKATLAVLPPDHMLQAYMRNAAELGEDAAIVDTFLHGRDVAYSVGDCLDLVDRCNLDFQSWLPHFSHLYYPNIHVSGDHPLFKWANGARERDIWSAMELFSSYFGQHCFIACRKDRAGSSYRIEVVPGNFDRLVPVWREPVLEEGNGTTLLRRFKFPDITLHGWQSLLASQIDGERTVTECLRAARVTQVDMATGLLESLRRLGYLLFALRRQ